MPCKFSRWFRICIVQLMLLPCMAMAAAGHPLEPLDLSSPRATLNSFLKTGDAFLLVLRDEYWDNPSPAVEARLKGLGVSMERMLDLSRLPPAVRFEMGRERAIYLYEVLSRIELPPASAIPDAAAYADDGADKPADGKPASWTIPHTEVTLERVADGHRAGQSCSVPGRLNAPGSFMNRRAPCPIAAMYHCSITPKCVIT
jgi:MscS family membrane protein